MSVIHRLFQTSKPPKQQEAHVVVKGPWYGNKKKVYKLIMQKNLERFIMIDPDATVSEKSKEDKPDDACVYILQYSRCHLPEEDEVSVQTWVAGSVDTIASNIIVYGGINKI